MKKKNQNKQYIYLKIYIHINNLIKGRSKIYNKKNNNINKFLLKNFYNIFFK